MSAAEGGRVKKRKLPPLTAEMKRQADPEMFSNDQIRQWIKDAKRLNAGTLRLCFHECGTFDGWCVEMTLRKHSVCERDERTLREHEDD